MFRSRKRSGQVRVDLPDTGTPVYCEDLLQTLRKEIEGKQTRLPKEEEKARPSHAVVMAAAQVEETGESRWAKMPPRLRTRDQKKALHNRTAVEKGLCMFPPFTIMDAWTMKCLRCERHIEQAKKFYCGSEGSGSPRSVQQYDLRPVTVVRYTDPNQPIHDRARSKTEVIDEAGTKGAEGQAAPPPQQTQVWLRALAEKSRTRLEIQRRGGNHNQRRIRSRQTDCVAPRRSEESKILPKEKQKRKKQMQESGEREHE